VTTDPEDEDLEEEEQEEEEEQDEEPEPDLCDNCGNVVEKEGQCYCNYCLSTRCASCGEIWGNELNEDGVGGCCVPHCEECRKYLKPGEEADHGICRNCTTDCVVCGEATWSSRSQLCDGCALLNCRLCYHEFTDENRKAPAPNDDVCVVCSNGRKYKFTTRQYLHSVDANRRVNIAAALSAPPLTYQAKLQLYRDYAKSLISSDRYDPTTGAQDNQAAEIGGMKRQMLRHKKFVQDLVTRTQIEQEDGDDEAGPDSSPSPE
jgi:hypothetical protein